MRKPRCQRRGRCQAFDSLLAFVRAALRLVCTAANDTVERRAHPVLERQPHEDGSPCPWPAARRELIRVQLTVPSPPAIFSSATSTDLVVRGGGARRSVRSRLTPAPAAGRRRRLPRGA